MRAEEAAREKKRQRAKETAAVGGGTKDTVPYHIWQDEVGLGAIREGAPAEYVNSTEGKTRLKTEYNRGSQIEHAVGMLVQFAKGWLARKREAGKQELVEQARETKPKVDESTHYADGKPIAVDLLSDAALAKLGLMVL